MKKVLFAMAIASMFGFVACNNNKPAEEPVEAEPIEAAVVEEVVDTNVVESMVEEVVDAVAETVAE